MRSHLLLSYGDEIIAYIIYSNTIHILPSAFFLAILDWGVSMKLWRYGMPLERLGGRYRLEGVLGSGGMADVCLAWDERDSCEVAAKVIKDYDGESSKDKSYEAGTDGIECKGPRR